LQSGRAGGTLGRMLHLPAVVASSIGKKNLELFASSAAAREFEARPEVWTVVEWSWTAGPPLRFVLRDMRGERVDVIVEDGGVWRMSREPVEPKIHAPRDIGPPQRLP
jgi:hypothetical protein